MKRKCVFGTADVAMIVATFFWGLNVVVSKNAVGETPETFRVFIYNGIRIPAATLLLFLTLKVMGEKIGIERKHIPRIAVLSFFGMFLFIVAFILGVSLTSSANTGIIMATTPLLILAISTATGIEHFTVRIATGISIGVFGMIILTFRRGGISFNAGDLFILISCLAWSIHTVYGKKMLQIYSPIVTVAWVYFFTSIYQFPLALYQMKDQIFSAVAPINWWYLFVSTTGSILLANILYYYAVNKIGPSRAGLYTNLTPVFTLFLAVAIRSETITPLQILGLALIIFGITLSKSRAGEKDQRTTT